MVYDRGGSATATLRAHEGVKQIGIQPKGNRAWSVAEAVRETVRSERGKTEGIIGTRKTDKYGFNKPTERLWHTLEMAGPRSILSYKLNKRGDLDGPTDEAKRNRGKGNHKNSFWRETRERQEVIHDPQKGVLRHALRSEDQATRPGHTLDQRGDEDLRGGIDPMQVFHSEDEQVLLSAGE